MEPLARPRTTSAGATAGTLAGLGIAAMALVAAAPGSPYQPVLTPNGKPKGFLTDLARGFGLGAIHGDLLLFIATIVSILAVGAFLLLLRETFRGGVSVRVVVGIVVAAHVALLFVPLLFSRDVYSYAFYGRIAGIYGGNPYVQTPLDHSTDLLWNYVGPKWVDTPAVYGPAWSSLSAGLSKVLPKPVDHVEAYRFLAIAASLLTCAAIWWVVRELWPERTAFAIAAFGANPVVLFHSVGSGHNDLLVALAVIVALGFVVRGKPLGAVATLTVGALVKATAGLPLLLLIAWYVARQPAERRRRALVTSVGLSAAIVTVFALPYVQLHDPTLGMLELAGHEGWLAPSMAVGRLLDFLSFHTLGWLARVVFAGVLLVSIVALTREVLRRARRMPVSSLAASWGWAMVLLTLLGPVLLPWYVVWALPLAWVLPRSARNALLATSALLAVSLWSAEPLRYPGGFDLNLFIGYFLVTPVFVLLVIDVLRDLRSRIDLGFAFEDEAAPADVVAIPEPAYDGERVAAATSEA